MAETSIHEPFKARLLRLVWTLSGKRPRLDELFTGFLKYRKHLSEVEARDVIPKFEDSEVRIRQCPIGAWSTPLIDVFVLLKAAQGFGSERILELGSFRGYTARLLAENTPPNTSITAVDIDPRHGAAYRGLPVEKKIIRKIGAITGELFTPEEEFDFIFVDANHDFQSAVNDTKVALDHLADHGVVLWHDYHHRSYFHGMSGVPEALQLFARERPIAALKGTTLALYSRFPGWETGKIQKTKSTGESVWDENQLRG